MKGKVCLITGGNSGIGYATAVGLAKKRATVVILARNKERGEEAVEKIKQESNNQNIHLLVADLSSQQSVREAAEKFKKTYKKLHVLINNAGVFNSERKETIDGIENTFATNYLSHFLLTHLLLDILKKNAPARIVNVASQHQGIHIDFDDLMLKKKYSFLSAVGQTKMAMILFTKALSKKLKGTGVTVNSLHPGLVKSHLLDDMNPFMRMFVHLFSVTPEKGAQTSIYLASSPEVEGVTGGYFSNSKPAKTIGQANDEEAEKKLWDISMKMANLT